MKHSDARHEQHARTRPAFITRLFRGADKLTDLFPGQDTKSSVTTYNKHCIHLSSKIKLLRKILKFSFNPSRIPPSPPPPKQKTNQTKTKRLPWNETLKKQFSKKKKKKNTRKKHQKTHTKHSCMPAFWRKFFSLSFFFFQFKFQNTSSLLSPPPPHPSPPLSLMPVHIRLTRRSVEYRIAAMSCDELQLSKHSFPAIQLASRPWQPPSKVVSQGSTAARLINSKYTPKFTLYNIVLK